MTVLMLSEVAVELHYAHRGRHHLATGNPDRAFVHCTLLTLAGRFPHMEARFAGTTGSASRLDPELRVLVKLSRLLADGELID